MELIQLTNDPKAVVVVTVNSEEPIAVSGTRVTCAEVPRPTPENTDRAGRWTLFRRLFVVILAVTAGKRGSQPTCPSLTLLSANGEPYEVLICASHKSEPHAPIHFFKNTLL